VGKEPAPRLLSTAPARRAATIAAAEALSFEPANWFDLAAGYAALAAVL
jgi:hypothetical protein